LASQSAANLESINPRLGSKDITANTPERPQREIQNRDDVQGIVGEFLE
jgi:hypothetical protein